MSSSSSYKKRKVVPDVFEKTFDNLVKLGFGYKHHTKGTESYAASFDGVLTEIISDDGKSRDFVGVCDLDHQPTQWHPCAEKRNLFPWKNDVRRSIKEPDRFDPADFFEESEIKMLVVVDGGNLNPKGKNFKVQKETKDGDGDPFCDMEFFWDMLMTLNLEHGTSFIAHSTH
jgi:hypothetical protein